MLVICAKIVHWWGILVILVKKEWEMKLLIDTVGKIELYRWIFFLVVKDVN
jgi:hypothetical protein